MAEKPIIFNSEMVRAILNGRKTQTRRIYKGPDPLQRRHVEVKSPYAVGDRLWVREAWWDLGHIENGKWQGRIDGHTCRPKYVASCSDPYADNEKMGIESMRPRQMPWRKTTLIKSTWRKRPSIHMPRWAARIFLIVKSVRVERLQEISPQDIWSEGYPDMAHLVPMHWFRALWDSLNTKRGYGWEVNPWVWVYEFEWEK